MKIGGRYVWSGLDYDDEDRKDKEKVRCYFFDRDGWCRNENRCTFAHHGAGTLDRKAAKSYREDRATTDCKYWNAGWCSRGNACAYAHYNSAGADGAHGRDATRNMETSKHRKQDIVLAGAVRAHSHGIKPPAATDDAVALQGGEGGAEAGETLTLMRDLPKNLVKHVDVLNCNGSLAAPLELKECHAALVQLGKTRLMFEVFNELPMQAFQSKSCLV